MFKTPSGSYAATLVVGSLLTVLGAWPVGGQEVLDFTGLIPGDSISGQGKVHPFLRIEGARDVNYIREDWWPPAMYLAPNLPRASRIVNGCFGEGLADRPTKGALESHHYVFTFSTDGWRTPASVKRFSARLFDFGDWNPHHRTYHEVFLAGYDANGDLVDKDILAFNTTDETVPVTITLDGGVLRPGVLAGDACDGTEPGDPGRFPFEVSGAGIVKVELKVLTQSDPNLAMSDVFWEFEDCGECSGKVTGLYMKYFGQSAASLQVIAKRGPTTDLVFDDTLQPDQNFWLTGPLSGNGGFWGTLGTEIRLYVDGALHTRIHTSCSQPIGAGLISGDFQVLQAFSRDGGLVCPLF